MSTSVVSSVIARKEALTNLIKASTKLDFYTVNRESKSWPAIRNNNNVCRMLVLDSSFNPPTKAHAELVNEAASAYPIDFFDATLLLFSTNNADKKLSGASVVQRVQMMELMAGSLNEQEERVAIGLTPHGKFIDKAIHITHWFEHNHKGRKLELYFIVGYDTIIRLMDKKYYATSVKEALSPFFERCYLICADRPNEDDKKQFWKNTFDMFGMEKINRIELHPDTAVISSTKVRMDVDHTKMVNDDILEFIKKEHIYE